MVQDFHSYWIQPSVVESPRRINLSSGLLRTLCSAVRDAPRRVNVSSGPWRTPDPAIVDSLRRVNVSSGQFATLGLAAADSLRRASARSRLPLCSHHVIRRDSARYPGQSGNTLGGTRPQNHFGARSQTRHVVELSARRTSCLTTRSHRHTCR